MQVCIGSREKRGLSLMSKFVGRDSTVQNLAKGWQSDELAQIKADTMDIERIRHLITNIDNSMKNMHNNPIDSKKLRDLKAFFEKELRNRGVQP